MRSVFTLLLLALAAAWPRLQLSEWRGTEARRVQIAQEMFETGAWMVPTLGHEPTLAKPPLHYWVLAAAMYLGDDPALLRLPSVLALWLLAVAVFGALRRHYGELSAWFGAAGLLLSPMVLTHVPSAEIDPLFTALTGLSVVWLARGVSFGGVGWIVAGGACGGLALLCKGPPYLMFLLGPLLVWGRRLRLRGWQWFVPPLLVVPLPYYGPLFLWRVPVGEFFATAQEESVGRMSQFGWTDLLELPVYFIGAVCMVMPLGWWTFHEFRGQREMRETVVGRDEAFLRMCAAALVSGALILALFPARPGRYLLPAIPLYCVGVAAAVASYARYGAHPSRVMVRVVWVLAIAGSLGLLAAPWIPFPFVERTPLLCLALAVAPMWVRSRRAVTAYALAVPLLAAWTALLDYGGRQAVAPRSLEQAARVVARELDALDVEQLATYGHVPSQIVLRLGARPIPPGDEYLRRPPTARWLLVEDPDRTVQFDPGDPVGYVDRLRVRLADKSIVLKERVE